MILFSAVLVTTDDLYWGSALGVSRKIGGDWVNTPMGAIFPGSPDAYEK